MDLAIMSSSSVRVTRADDPWMTPYKNVTRSADIVPESRELVNENAAPAPPIYLNAQAVSRAASNE
jgi:hypothetical protein